MKKTIVCLLSFLIIVTFSACSAADVISQAKDFITPESEKIENENWQSIRALRSGFATSLAEINKDEFISLFTHSTQSTSNFTNQVEEIFAFVDSSGYYGRSEKWPDTTINPIYNSQNTETGWYAWDSILRVDIATESSPYFVSFSLAYYYQQLTDSPEETGVTYCIIQKINSDEQVEIGSIPDGQSIPNVLQN